MPDMQSDSMVRETICFPSPGTRRVLQPGEPEFQGELSRLYGSAESIALERMIKLKGRLNSLPTSDFFSELTEGLSKLLGADITFVMKRMLVDEHDAAVEMPPIGEPGSCLMAAALHYTASDGTTATVRETKFHAWGCPCAYMRHDKVFLIPDHLNDFITNNPNAMPKPAEAYLALPLFSEGKCFAHFGAMWSKEGLLRRGTSWAFTEMLLHSLEDVILDRLLEGANFVRPNLKKHDKLRLIPHDAVTVAQSLRPYAGSLSHELRTPMQGVVGMLDVMYATVEEAAMNSTDSSLRRIFETLKENIEVVQDSSRRAVEAADNVVHAYDMNMSVPDASPSLVNDDSLDLLSPGSVPVASSEKRPEIFVAGSDISTAPINKRKREEFEEDGHRFRPYHNPATMPTAPLTPPDHESHDDLKVSRMSVSVHPDIESNGPQPQLHRVPVPGLRQTSMRRIFQRVVSEGLKVGGRPDKAITEETEFGERIEVRTRGSNGTASTKVIEWSVDSNVPSSMYIDEKDLTKLVSCLFLNAIKFTDTNDGRVSIHAKMSSRSKYISIRVCDNGVGIPAAFLPRLFKAFSQENASLTRQSEGLGLGLMVAKGIARKLGGDLTCIRADTAGPERGSEFEIKIPLMAGETVSRPSSPFSSPMPRKAVLADTPDGFVSPFAAPVSTRSRSASPRRLARALHAATEPTPAYDYTDRRPSQETPLTRDFSTHSAGNGFQSTPHIDLSQPWSRSQKRPSRSAGEIDRELAAKYPLNFLVAEDNKINRKLLVSMLAKLGYHNVYEAHDGSEAVRQMSVPRPARERVDVVLMDLWMPQMDGYEATERILNTGDSSAPQSASSSEPDQSPPTVLAVTADVTNGALERAAQVGMKGFMTKPYKISDLQRLITDYCTGAYFEMNPNNSAISVS